jgi:hypothetical protein
MGNSLRAQIPPPLPKKEEKETVRSVCLCLAWTLQVIYGGKAIHNIQDIIYIPEYVNYTAVYNVTLQTQAFHTFRLHCKSMRPLSTYTQKMNAVIAHTAWLFCCADLQYTGRYTGLQ